MVCNAVDLVSVSRIWLLYLGQFSLQKPMISLILDTFLLIIFLSFNFAVNQAFPILLFPVLSTCANTSLCFVFYQTYLLPTFFSVYKWIRSSNVLF